MDPLSICASCIAVLGAITASGKGIGKLIGLRDAPEELLELSNEVQSLKLLSTQTQHCLLSIHGSQAYHDHKDALSSQLESMRRSMNDLEAFIEFELKRVDEDGASSTMSKKRWLQAGGKLERHNRKITTARDNLSTSMTIIGSQLSGQNYALQLQSISYRDVQRVNHEAASPATAMSDSGLTMQAERIFSRFETHALGLEDASSGTDHTSRQLSSLPGPSNPAFNPGHVFYFPTWLAARALTISGYARDLTSPGASWALKIPIVVSSAHPIWRAVMAGNTSYLQDEFSTSRSLWIIDENGNGLLNTAIHSGQLETFRFLLAQSASLDIENQHGETAVTNVMRYSWRSRQQVMNAIGLVMEDLMDECAFTKLHASAARLSGYDRISTELLQANFSDIDQPDRIGMTPLHWACRCGDAPAIQLLLEWNSDPLVQDRRGRTCFHHVAWSDDIDSVRLLLNSGATVDTPDYTGQTAIFMSNVPEVLELFVERGANVNHTDYDNHCTPLVVAAYTGCPTDKINLLVRLGADVSALDKYGHDAIMIAIVYDDPKTLHRLLRLTDTFRQTKSSSMWVTDCDGGNALYCAALFSGIEVMQVLEDANLEGLLPTAPDKWGRTPTDCFYLDRDRSCTILREPFEIEEEAWWALMESSCHQNDIDFTLFEPEWRKEYEASKARMAEVESDDEEDADVVDDDDTDADDGDTEEFTDAVEDQNS